MGCVPTTRAKIGIAIDAASLFHSQCAPSPAPSAWCYTPAGEISDPRVGQHLAVAVNQLHRQPHLELCRMLDWDIDVGFETSRFIDRGPSSVAVVTRSPTCTECLLQCRSLARLLCSSATALLVLAPANPVNPSVPVPGPSSPWPGPDPLAHHTRRRHLRALVLFLRPAQRIAACAVRLLQIFTVACCFSGSISINGAPASTECAKI